MYSFDIDDYDDIIREYVMSQKRILNNLDKIMTEEEKSYKSLIDITQKENKRMSAPLSNEYYYAYKKYYGSIKQKYVSNLYERHYLKAILNKNYMINQRKMEIFNRRVLSSIKLNRVFIESKYIMFGTMSGIVIFNTLRTISNLNYYGTNKLILHLLCCGIIASSIKFNLDVDAYHKNKLSNLEEKVKRNIKK